MRVCYIPTTPQRPYASGFEPRISCTHEWTNVGVANDLTNWASQTGRGYRVHFETWPFRYAQPRVHELNLFHRGMFCNPKPLMSLHNHIYDTLLLLYRSVSCAERVPEWFVLKETWICLDLTRFVKWSVINESKISLGAFRVWIGVFG